MVNLTLAVMANHSLDERKCWDNLATTTHGSELWTDSMEGCHLKSYLMHKTSSDYLQFGDSNGFCTKLATGLVGILPWTLAIPFKFSSSILGTSKLMVTRPAHFFVWCWTACTSWLKLSPSWICWIFLSACANRPRGFHVPRRLTGQSSLTDQDSSCCQPSAAIVSHDVILVPYLPSPYRLKRSRGFSGRSWNWYHPVSLVPSC